MHDLIIIGGGPAVRALRGVAELARTAAQVYLIAPDASGAETPLARELRRRPNCARRAERLPLSPGVVADPGVELLD